MENLSISQKNDIIANFYAMTDNFEEEIAKIYLNDCNWDL